MSAGTMAIAGRPTLRMESHSVTVSCSGTTLLGHITHVLGVRTRKQVVGIDTRGIVAAMANAHAFLKVAVRQLVGHTVSQERSPVLRVDDAVTCRDLTSGPDPAITRLVYSRPKTREENRCILRTHRKFTPSGAIPRLFAAARGTCFANIIADNRLLGQLRGGT